MKMQKVARTLREHQIDFDFLPSEALNQENGRLSVNGRIYDVMIVPGCEVLPDGVLKFIREATFPVYCTDFAPDGIKVVKLKELPALLSKMTTVPLSKDHDGIRVYHGKRGNNDAYFLFNASAWEVFDGTVSVAANYRYDAMENQLYRFNGSIKLGPCESTLLLNLDAELPALDIPFRAEKAIRIEEDQLIKSVRDHILRYETELNCDIQSERIVLSLPQVRETAKVWCNGEFIGERIAAPFDFDLTSVWKTGTNSLAIHVTPTMEQKVLQASSGRDLFTFLQKTWPAYGLADGIEIHY